MAMATSARGSERPPTCPMTTRAGCTPISSNRSSCCSNLAEYAHRLTARLIHQFPHNLSLAPLGQQWGIKRLRIEAESGDDGHSGPRRQLLQEFQIPAHVGMASIDYAGDTLAPCRGQFCKHQVEIVRGTEHGLLGHGGISLGP